MPQNRVKKLSPSKSFCSYICLQLLETTWSPQITGYLAPKKKPLPVCPWDPRPLKWELLPGIPKPQPLTTARPASGFQAFGSPLIRPSPGQCGRGRGPQMPAPLSPEGEAQDRGNSPPPRRRQHPPQLRAGSAEGGDTARPNAPPHECPAGPKKPCSRPAGLRASAIRPPNSRPARTPRRPGAGEGGGASSRAGGRKRGGRKMARSARA